MKMMSVNKNDDSDVYIFQGNEGERIPPSVGKLIVNSNVPEKLCYNFIHLPQVRLPIGLERIDLQEIKISKTVRFIGREAFKKCEKLKTIEFVEGQAASPHQLQAIGERAFSYCTSLPRIKLPSCVNLVCGSAFQFCCALKEANLSKTCVTEISKSAFACCYSLQRVSLPNTLNCICNGAFFACHQLVTVVIPLDSQSIRIGSTSFGHCRCLANLWLPRNSTSEEDSFDNCDTLHDCFGRASTDIVAGLIARFDNYPVHRICYDHSAVTAQELRQRIGEQEEGEKQFVDALRMTPSHVLFSTAEPRVELLEILLDRLPYPKMLNSADANGKRASDYLINICAGDATADWLQRTLQKWMVDPLVDWGAMLWVEDMKTKVGAVLRSELHNNARKILFNEAHSAFWHYKKIESTSILEMALWKWRLKSGRNNDGSKRQALDRGERRCVCGSDVVIPNVIAFMGDNE